jgi:hypothetical protein
MPPKVKAAFWVLGVMGIVLFAMISMMRFGRWAVPIAGAIVGVHAVALAVWWLIRVAKGSHSDVPEYHRPEMLDALPAERPSNCAAVDGAAELDWSAEPPPAQENWPERGS